MKSSWVFDGPAATGLTLARQTSLTGLLSALKRQLDLHSALDLGCGVGHFSSFLSGMGLKVVGVDGRAENLQEAARRFPDITFHSRDIEDPKLVELGPFDLVLCLGLLYHLENPFRAIKNLSAIATKIAVIESVCVPYLRPILELGDEAIVEDQGLNYVAFYPSESCLVKMLYRSGFAYVYRPHPLPEHEKYRESFSKRRVRTMILASKVPLTLGSLTVLPEPVNPLPEPANAGDPWATPWAIARDLPARLTRFMLKPWPEKVRSVRSRWVRSFAEAPFPLRSSRGTPSEVWIDVGAHLGELTFPFAKRNPSLRVYAFEPNLKLALQRMGVLRNFVVLPMAVGENDGCADFYVNSYDFSSSLLPIDPEGVGHWIGGELLREEEKITVPTIRLDTFMNRAGISNVAYLKVDAQGADLAVVRSAGERLKDIDKITLEVSLTPKAVYSGTPPKEEVMRYMAEQHFLLASSETQTYGQEENLTFVRKI